MRILSILLVVIVLLATHAQQPQSQPITPDPRNQQGQPKPELSDIEKTDNLVRMIAAGHAGHATLNYFVEYFEERAAAIHDQAEAAYRHRLERKQMDKKYRVEIEYSYYKAMAKNIDEMKAPRAVLDTAQLEAERGRRLTESKAVIAQAKQEWKNLAMRLVSMQKRSPLRQRGATDPNAQNRSSSSSGVAAR